MCWLGLGLGASSGVGARVVRLLVSVWSLAVVLPLEEGCGYLGYGVGEAREIETLEERDAVEERGGQRC